MVLKRVIVGKLRELLQALAIQRALHDLGFFLGVVDTERQQCLWLEEAIDMVLARNAQRGREKGRAPYTYSEVKGCLVQFLNRKGKAESSLYGIDPYGGRKAISQEDRLTENIAERVEKRMRQSGAQVNSYGQQPQHQHQMQKQAGQKQGGGGSGGQQPRRTLEEKIRELCQDFNSSGGCSTQGPCNKGKHVCSNNNGRNFVCMRRHSASTCRNPQVMK